MASAVAPLFQQPVPSVKLDLGRMDTSNTFLTQMLSARLPKGKKIHQRKSGFLTDRGSANGNRAQISAAQPVLASEMAAKALASAGSRSGAGGGK